MRRRHRSLILALALAAAVLAAFYPVGGNDFVAFDDDAYVTENPRVLAGLSPAGVAWAFTTLHAANWHPLTWISHMLDVELFGLEAGRHHLTSLLLHLGNTLLLFSFLRAATGAFWRSGLAAALFALHPLRVESVAWVAQRKDVLALLFLLLTLSAYRRFVSAPSPGRYGATVALYAAGLMAKPTLVTVPVALLLLDRWPLGRLGGLRPGRAERAQERPPASRVFIEKLPFLLLAAAVSVGTFFAQSRGGAVNTIEEWPVRDRLFTALTGYLAYLGKTLLPADLAVYYPVPKGGFTAAAAVASLALLAALTALVLACRRRLPWLEFGWSWYLVTLLPVIGLVQVGTQAIADRYLLLPHIGLAVVASWGLAEFLSPAPRARLVVVPATLLALLALSLKTNRQISHWRDGVTLYRHALAVTADNWLIHYNFGTLLRQQGNLTGAAAELEAAISAKPDLADAHNNLGDVLLALGRAPAAEAHFLKAVEIQPGYLPAYNNLGAALLNRGEHAGAIRYLSEVVARDPGYVDARFNLASAYLAAGDRAAAIREFREVLHLSPADAMARYHLERLLSPTP
jgi:tetratricopeptide (TPR) repeat protein